MLSPISPDSPIYPPISSQISNKPALSPNIPYISPNIPRYIDISRYSPRSLRYPLDIPDIPRYPHRYQTSRHYPPICPTYARYPLLYPDIPRYIQVFPQISPISLNTPRYSLRYQTSPLFIPITFCTIPFSFIYNHHQYRFFVPLELPCVEFHIE